MEIQADMKTSTYTFLNNKLKLNDVEASLDGWVQMPDTTKMVMDLKLNTEKVAFKDLLSLVPGLYVKDFKDMKTAGNLTMAASVKGTMKGESYPAFNVKLAWTTECSSIPLCLNRLQTFRLTPTSPAKEDR